MHAWNRSRILKFAPFKSFSYRKLFCERAHISKGADEIGRNRLIRPFVVSGNFIDLRSRGWLVCGRLAYGMDLHIVRFMCAASGLKF